LLNDKDSDFVILTYKDNEALEPSLVREIEKARERANDNGYWSNWWKVYGLGEIGTLQGVVFDNWKQVSEIPTDAKFIAYGKDFGYTNDPTTLIGVWQQGGELWLKEFLYETGLTNPMICERLRSFGIKKEEIIADSAEPKSIQEIRMQGFNIHPATKGKDSITSGIDVLQRYKMNVTADSLNLIKELRNYKWKQDKDGKTLNEPIDYYNHCFAGETLIETITGQKRIDEIKEGELVLTSEGYKKVLKLFNNGIQQVNNYLIHSDIFSINLCSTKEHKIKTKTGWIQISQLQSGQQVYLHKSLTEKNIDFIQKKDIFQEEQKECTQPFGFSLMAKSIRDFMFTIRTEIHGIIELKIWDLLRVVNIYRSMVRKDTPIILSGQNLLMKKEDCLQRYGMQVKRGRSGIEYKPLKAGLKNLLLKKFVLNVKKNFNQSAIDQQQYIVTKIVKCEQGQNGYAQVYDLMVDDCHEYYANGLLVHNCIDPLRYVALNKLQLVKRGVYGIT